MVATESLRFKTADRPVGSSQSKITGDNVATIFYEHDANPSALKGKTIAIFGYGSQGHAQAQNLRDSGYNVIVGLDPQRPSAQQAKADGMTVLPPAEAAKRADWIQILTPDETQGDFYESRLNPGWCSTNYVQRRNRERSVWRASGVVRRPDLTHQERIRNSGRGWLRAGNRLFRVSARDEADR